MALHGCYNFGGEICEWCGYERYSRTTCPDFIRAHQYSQIEVNSGQSWDQHSQNYEHGWSSHPNFSWSDPYPPDQFDPYYQPSVSEEPDPFGYGPPLDYIEMNARDMQLEQTINSLMLSQITFQTETRQQLGDLSAQISQLSILVSQFQQERSQFPSQEESLNDQLLGPSPDLTSQGSVTNEINLIAPLMNGPEFNETLQPQSKLAPPLEPVTHLSLKPPVFVSPEIKREVVHPMTFVPLHAPFAIPMLDEPICQIDPVPFILHFVEAPNVEFFRMRGLTDDFEFENWCRVSRDPSFPFNPG